MKIKEHNIRYVTREDIFEYVFSDKDETFKSNFEILYYDITAEIGFSYDGENFEYVFCSAVHLCFEVWQFLKFMIHDASEQQREIMLEPTIELASFMKYLTQPNREFGNILIII